MWRWKRGCTVAIVIEWPFSTEFYFARDAAQSDVVFEGCVIGNSISPPHRGFIPANWTFLSFSSFSTAIFRGNAARDFFQLCFSLFFLALSSGGGMKNCERDGDKKSGHELCFGSGSLADLRRPTPRRDCRLEKLEIIDFVCCFSLLLFGDHLGIHQTAAVNEAGGRQGEDERCGGENPSRILVPNFFALRHEGEIRSREFLWTFVAAAGVFGSDGGENFFFKLRNCVKVSRSTWPFFNILGIAFCWWHFVVDVLCILCVSCILVIWLLFALSVHFSRLLGTFG